MVLIKRLLMALPLAALGLGLPACEEKPAEDAQKMAEEPKAEPDKAAAAQMAPAAPAAEPMAPPPMAVCQELVEAIKAKDEVKVLSLSTPSSAGALGAEGAKEHVMVTLQGVTCGAAKEDGEAALVAVTGGSMPQDVPFTKVGNAWKFDAAAYLTKYPPMPKKEMVPEKGHKKGKMMPAHGKKHRK